MRSAAFVFRDVGFFAARILLVVFTLAPAVIGVSSAQSLSAAPSTVQECQGFSAGGGAAFVEQCGDRLHAWRLTLPRSFNLLGHAQNDWHGRFFFNCEIEPMCKGETAIIGRFVPLVGWQQSSRNERDIYELTDRLTYPWRPLPPMPPIACPLYDVVLAGMSGRAVCFSDPGGSGSTVVVVVADDRVAFLLSFYQRDMSVSVLKDEVSELLSRFRVERATGDAALMRWLR